MRTRNNSDGTIEAGINCGSSDVYELKRFVALCEFCGIEEFSFDPDNYFDSPHIYIDISSEQYKQFIEKENQENEEK